MSTITNPTTSPTPALSPTPGPGAAVGTSQIDWNNDAKTAVGAGLGMIPEVGGLLSAMVKIFWPSTGENVWGEVQAQAEAMVNQKLSDYAVLQANDALNGLQSALALYLQDLKATPPDPEQIRIQWTSTNTVFVAKCPAFQTDGYEVPLLPQFAQFVNMHLSLMRDGVMYGTTWGMTQGDVQTIETNLQAAITTYTTYAQGVITAQFQTLEDVTRDGAQVQPFRGANAYNRAMTLTVMDYSAMWPYFDPTVHPAPQPADAVVLSREIFSDPCGSLFSGNDIWPEMLAYFPSPPTQPVGQVLVKVNVGGELGSVTVTYPPGGGPHGMTTTPEMGCAGNDQYEYQHPFNISAANPINHAEAFADSVVHGIQWYTDTQGGGSGVLGNTAGTNYNFAQEGHILSSIWIHGTDKGCHCDCVVFGFQLQNQNAFAADPAGLRLFYVTSPSGTTLEALAARYAPTPGAAAGATPVSLADLQAQAAAEGWDAQRSAYQSYLAAVANNANK